MDESSTATPSSNKYTVVARRYRPKTFAELVGQSTVSQALLNAIQTNRVGHAYLFTGARGVGKTSTARIFAKALNAASETDGSFDPDSDIAQAIDSGEDMDVIEIDGASNRGIDEIRQLRANAAIRPSRSRYKIYIIDEVHMLTTQAFNALLKTLEEPPAHVKFIFCTTDPEKMPITVLSRCQRFDFPPVKTDEILTRLKFICENEGTQADDAALQIIARRAAGSMRDSQSLLEQLLSFGGQHIRVDDVHAMLGTADETRLATFSSRLIERDAAGALQELESAASEGVDVGQLAEQLLGYLRDMMVVTVGASDDLIKTANPNSAEQLKEWGTSWGTASLMAAIQILDETIVKMRHSVQSRVLMEIALVQICQLQDLQALTELVQAFAKGQPAPPPRSTLPTGDDSKKKAEPVAAAGANAPAAKDQTQSAAPSPSSAGPSVSQSAPVIAPQATPAAPAPTAEKQPATPAYATSTQTTQKTATPGPPHSNSGNTPPGKTNTEQKSAPQKPVKALDDPVAMLRKSAVDLGGLIIECTNMIVRVDKSEPGKWKVLIGGDGSFAMEYFKNLDNVRRLAQAVSKDFGVDAQLEFHQTNEAVPDRPAEAKPVVEQENRPVVPQSQLIRNAMNNPIVKSFVDMFEGQVVRVDKAPGS